MCAEKREVINWIKDVSKVSGVETMVVQEHQFSRPLTETLLLFTIMITMTLAVSAAYYLQVPNAPQYMPDQPQNHMQESTAEPRVNEVSTTTTTEASTTTVPDTTEPTTTQPPQVTTTEATTSTTITTTPTTLTNIKCGFDMEPPCITETGLKCEPGNKIGAEGLCHQLSCVKTVPSGNTDGSCGSFAMSYCDETK
jgi:hypothetical protein